MGNLATTHEPIRKGLVLGFHSVGADSYSLTRFGKRFNRSASGRLRNELASVVPVKPGQAQLHFRINATYEAVAVVGLGDINLWSQSGGAINQHKENIRNAASKGAQALQAHNILLQEIEEFDCPQSAAEGAKLGTYVYREHESPAKRIKLSLFSLGSDDYRADAELNNFAKGLVLAHAQNWTRKSVRNIGMSALLSVSKDSNGVSTFVELHYRGGSPFMKPIVMVGKGIAFSSCGNCWNQSGDDMMRAGMGGAANVDGAMKALAKLKVKLNIIGLLPMCDPDKVVHAMNGKSIRVVDKGCEGHLILCDTLVYAVAHNPLYIINVATMTSDMRSVLGDSAAAVFTNDDRMWDLIHRARMETGDRVWRFPLSKQFLRQLDDSVFTFRITSKGPGVGSCVTAAFLQEFVKPNIPWLHVDMFNIVNNTSAQPYTSSGMSGRPMRTPVEFICRQACIDRLIVTTDVQND